jgi:hypothetical protein
MFVRSPRKSIRSAAPELQMVHSTEHRVLRQRTCLYAYKLQVVQAITPDDRVARKEFAVTMLEATFHVSGKVNKQNVRIWGSEHSHATMEHIRDRPMLMCGVACCTIV